MARRATSLVAAVLSALMALSATPNASAAPADAIANTPSLPPADDVPASRADGAPASTADDAPATDAPASDTAATNARDDIPGVLTLEDALRIALQRAPTLAIARSETETAILQRFAVQMERSPQFTFTVAAGPGPIGRHYLDDDGNTVDDLRYIGGLSLGGEAKIVVPLTTFGKLKLAKELADMGIHAAELAEEVAALEARYEAFRAYTGLQWYHSMLPILSEVAGRMDQAEEELEDRLDDGDFSARTSLRQLTIYRAEIVKLQGELKQVGFLAQQAIRLVLDLSPDTPVSPFDATVPARNDLPPVEELLAYATEHRPDFRRLQIAVDASEQAIRLQRRMLSPNAFFQARGAIIYTPTIEGSRPGISVTPDRFNDLSGELLVGLRWDIQPGRHRAAVRMAEQRAETVRHKRDGAVLALDLQIQQAWLDAEQQLNLARAQYEAKNAAQAWLNQRAFQYDQGLASFDDLVSPLKAYYEAVGSYYEALLRYKLHVAHVGVLIGWEDPTTLPRLNSDR